jgi:PKD repeat protein
VSSNIEETVLTFEINSYDFNKVKTSEGNAKELVAPKTGKFLVEGAPELLKMAGSIIVPDELLMQVEVLDSHFTEHKNIHIAPSKGNLLRTVDPDTVPYVYGPEYDRNEFYPGNLAQLGDPYILRDFRGQAVIVNPFQYNPVTKVLRVYDRITVRVSVAGERGENVFNRRETLRAVDPTFADVYTTHFLNYSLQEYTPLPDNIGNYLIVSYSSFMDEMADFVTWKESIGYSVDLVDYSTIGSSSALKTYVANYYNSNGLTFLLLVGDHAQVPTSSTSAGDSDNNYGYIVGSDHYLDIFVGRFSAETAAHVTTQVDRTIHYERDVLSSATFFRHAIGMASNEGPGHNNEYDAAHMDYILSDLSGDGYTTHKNYQDGGSSSNLSSLINNGAGTMWYCGHGSNTAWTCGWTFSTTNVNALVNEWELPAVFSVACVIGNFKSITCFCESWLRATNNGNPTGAVVHAGSTINQSWTPPMDAQDEMADLLVAGTRTFGGVFANGMFKMIDINGSGGESMADTWTCFGDASVQLRTPDNPNGPTPSTPDPPVAEFTADTLSVMTGGNVNFTDQSTNTPTSWSWTFEGGTPATSTAQNPTVTYNSVGTFNVSLTATNAAGNDTETKIDYITVTAPQPPVANFTASSTSIYEGQNVTFTDTSTNSPTSWSWSFEGGSPATSTAPNPTVTYSTAGTYDVSLTAANAAGSDGETRVDYITVTVPPVSYCSSSGTNQNYEYIAGVAVADLNNASGASPYTDYTSMTANLTAGASAGVSLTPGFVGSSYTEYWKIWIDYNIDGDFADAGEEVFSGSSSSTINSSFTVASGASGLTRMRVSMSYSSYPPYCGTFTYGEVEDYTVNIGGGCTQYTLTTNVVGNGSIGLSPSGGTYCAGTVVTLTATPDSGWQFDNWSGDLGGSTNPTTITMTSNKSVTANFSVIPGGTGTVGNTTIFGSTSTSGYRRAMPFTMSENGTITSVTMYHTGGSGNMIMGVYNGSSTPQNRIGVTASTAVSGSTGWQTINLTTPVFVSSGSTVWLAWVYQSNPGIRYQTGSPGRYQSSQTWSGGMPDPFGSGSQTSYIYSIYATYNK